MTQKNHQNQKKNFLDTSDLVKKTDYNFEISEIENKIPSISSLVTTSAFTAVKNKIPDVSNLVRKTDYDTKISEHEKKLTGHDYDKYITTPGQQQNILLQDQHKQI